MNATILSALADSGLFIVGNQLNEESEHLRLMPGEDDDSHVLAFEEWDQRCMCCCCTGECRDHGDDNEWSFTDTLSAGFVEGDYPVDEPAACACQETLSGWSSLEDCLPECRNFMGYGIAPRACWLS